MSPLWLNAQIIMERHGNLHVDGGKIKNEHNKVFILRGVSLGWHSWWPDFYNKSVVSQLASDWGCNVIRVAVGVDVENGYIDNPEWTLELVETVVDAAIDNGIYVIIDWHCHDIQLESAIDFFSSVAKKYGDKPNVLFEIFNEPDKESWNDIKRYAVEVIDTIRLYSPNIIIVGTPSWSQDVDMAASDPISGYDNIVYSLHFYAASHGENLRYKASLAVEKGLPLLVTECSPARSDGDGNLGKKEFRKWDTFMDKNRIGRVLWGIYDKPEATAMVVNGVNPSKTWQENDLSEMGQFAKKYVGSPLFPVWLVSLFAVIALAIFSFVFLKIVNRR